MEPHCPRQIQTTKDQLISRNYKTYIYIHKIEPQYLMLMLPITLPSMIIYHLRDTLLNIDYDIYYF